MNPGDRAHPRCDLVLIGLRGSGKTTLGRAVAERLAAPFIDLDDHLARRAGTTSAGEALRRLGEPAFRRLEAELLTEVLDPGRRKPAMPAVIALGGGTPTAPAAAGALEHARRECRLRIVLLEAPVDLLAARIRRDPVDRPPLTGLPEDAELAHLADARLPAYRRLADAVIDTGSRDAGAAIEALQCCWLEGPPNGRLDA